MAIAAQRARLISASVKKPTAIGVCMRGARQKWRRFLQHFVHPISLRVEAKMDVKLVVMSAPVFELHKGVTYKAERIKLVTQK